MEFELGAQTEWVHGLCLIWSPNAIVSCILISPVKRVFFMYQIKEWMEFTLMCGLQVAQVVRWLHGMQCWMLDAMFRSVRFLHEYAGSNVRKSSVFHIRLCDEFFQICFWNRQEMKCLLPKC